MGSGYAKKKKEAKKMQEQFMQMQANLKNETVEGTAGGGMIRLVLNGEHEMKEIKINPECVDPDDVEGLEDLIRAAHLDATKKLEKKMPDLPSGMGGLPF